MGFLISPGVEVNEIDLTNIIPAQATSIGAFAGFFKWGPTDTIVNVSSEKDLARIFGSPTEAGELENSFFTAASFLKYGNSLKVVRANVKDILDGEEVERVGGKNAIDSLSDADPETFNISSFEEFQNNNTALNGQNTKFVARYFGELGNSLKVIVVDESNADSIPSEISDVLSYKNIATTAWAQSFCATPTTVFDELSIVVIDANGQFTGNPGEVLEKFEGLSYAPNAKNEYNQSNYYVDVINNQSSYLYAVNTGAIPLLSTATSITAILTAGSYTFEEGTNGGDFTASDVIGALTLFEDSESVDINLLFAHNFDEPTYDKTLDVDSALIQIVESRRDCVAFISAPIQVAKETSDVAKFEAVISKFQNLNLPSTSYAVFDSSPVYMYNRYRDAYVWVASCGHMAGLCAKTDRLAAPWFSPAGFNRGALLGVTKLAYNPKGIDRDELYSNRVNSICSIPGQGIVLYGDKTALSKPSAFDRINVRRLFITIEKAIATAAKFQLFELNDEFTRASFRNAVNPYLRDVQGRRGIIDFRVVCDETNNTSEVIDTNRFVGTIYIKPSRSINFITLNFVATRTGVSFEEIIGQ